MSELETREILVELLRRVLRAGLGVRARAAGSAARPTAAACCWPRPASTRSGSGPTTSSSSTPGRARHAAARRTTRLRPSECNSIFGLAAAKRAAWSVVHSHALTAVLAGDSWPEAATTSRSADLEMLKGIPGVGNQDIHLVPVIRNTAARARARGGAHGACSRTRGSPAPSPSSSATTAPTSGATDVWDAKRHTEVYHFLFEATVARREPRDRGSATPDDPRSRRRGRTSTDTCARPASRRSPRRRSTSSTSPGRSRRTS